MSDDGAPGPNRRTSFQAQLDALRADYSRALPERLRGVDDAWERVKSHPDDDVAWRKLIRLVHGLAGSGGSFGFQTLSQTARQLEYYMDSLMTKENRNLSAEVADIESQLATMKRNVTAVSRGDDYR